METVKLMALMAILFTIITVATYFVGKGVL